MDSEDKYKIRHGKLQEGFLRNLSSTLHWFEVFLAVISVILVIIGTIHLVSQMANYKEYLHGDQTYKIFEEGLSYILLLVVGIELAIMLVRRTPEILVEVMFFVIARKMLIKTEHFYELLIGVAALAALFAIRKYL